MVTIKMMFSFYYFKGFIYDRSYLIIKLNLLEGFIKLSHLQVKENSGEKEEN